MEVVNTTYHRKMLGILHAITNATFVSVDLEMSGIYTRERSRGSKPDLQQYYEEVAEAASLFQALQLGITVIQEDRERELYIARPYNIPISPLSFDEKNSPRIERNFAFSSGSCTFLRGNKFDFGKVFSQGVTYMSQEEEISLITEYNARSDNLANTPDIIVEDQTTLEFLADVRKTISTWINAPKPKFEFVNIGDLERPLNGYQRRLLYQLVRNEFPGLKIFAPKRDCGFMQVEEIDVAAEQVRQERNLQYFNKRLFQQKGLSFIFAALTGGDLSGIDPLWFYNRYSQNPEDQLDAITVQLEDIKEKLKHKKAILVGHNLFIDLAFLYKTFIGKLPKKVEDFQRVIHEKFPVVIDTKFVASHSQTAMDPKANLKDLLKSFNKVDIPSIVLHEDHNSYGSNIGKEHEAGFDSWMTAKLFTKLSAKLYAKRVLIEPSLNPELISSNTDEEATQSNPDVQRQVTPRDRNNPYSILAIQGSNDHPVRKPRKPKNNATSKPIPNAPINPYPVLAIEGFEDLTISKPPDDKSAFNLSKLEPDTGGIEPAEPSQWIPAMDSRFWKTYVNKLQINSTEVGFCDLSGDDDEDSVYYDCKEELSG